MPVPKKKTSKSRRDKRRYQGVPTAIPVGVCAQCGSPTRSHRMCPTCKTYKGREIEPLEA
jgi:large subunit ribosomal protein L32